MDVLTQKWYERRTSRVSDWPVARLQSAKGSTRVSVVLPALNEEKTVGAVVAMVRELRDTTGLVDEIVVMDSGSTDRTAECARLAGAEVYHRDDVLPHVGSRPGKGEVLWKSLACTSGDIVVYVDSDLHDPHPELVTGLLGPLLTDEDVQFVKGCYDRPMSGNGGAAGGRVTELMARPAINRMVPELSGIIQPLAGEFAGRRELLERLPYVSGYGVDVALLVDALRIAGRDAIAQVDLGVRMHRNQSTAALGRMAFQVMTTLASRDSALHGLPRNSEYLTQFERGSDGRWRPVVHDVTIDERPPMVDVEGYWRTAADRAS